MTSGSSMAEKQTIFITGGAGYVGEMLCDQFAKRDDVAHIIALDKEPQSEFGKKIPKVTYIQANMSDGGWEEQVRAQKPDIVIHTAWQIREMYGQAAEQWRWNIDGSDRVFDFAFKTPSVEKLIYFSTASSYSARVENTLEHRFTEDESFRDDEYRYAAEKKAAEEHLREKYEAARERGGHVPQVFVVRPAAITGPRGRFMRTRFGLQSALSGQLKGSLAYRLVSLMTKVVPATEKWCRQFIHEDDVADIVELLAFSALDGEYEVFNITPPGDVVRPTGMGLATGKKVAIVPPWVVRFAFFVFRHLTRGKIPTSRGGWRFYSYPIVMDGSKITRKYGFEYRCDSFSAFYSTEGRYEAHVPEERRRAAPEKTTST